MTETQTPEYRTSGDLERVTETAWFLAEGSRGGYGFRGETRHSNSETVYMWPVNSAAERELKRYVDYVEACITELVDAFNIHMWRIHGSPDGPV